jgi:hypothetical protein
MLVSLYILLLLGGILSLLFWVRDSIVSWTPMSRGVWPNIDVRRNKSSGNAKGTKGYVSFGVDAHDGGRIYLLM